MKTRAIVAVIFVLAVVLGVLLSVWLNPRGLGAQFGAVRADGGEPTVEDRINSIEESVSSIERSLGLSKSAAATQTPGPLETKPPDASSSLQSSIDSIKDQLDSLKQDVEAQASYAFSYSALLPSAIMLLVGLLAASITFLLSKLHWGA